MNEIIFSRLGQGMASETLENGLRVYVFPKPGFTKSFAMIATDFGSVDSVFETDEGRVETPDGVAHFLEHKLFEQPDGVNAMQLFGRTGASPNAFTSQTMTAYHFECTERLEENLRILLSYVFTPHFTDENVKKEQGIIGQEIGMIDDEPNFQAYMGALQALYAVHPIRRSVAGTVESISRITKETLFTCHRAFYSPSNMVLCVCGDVEPQRVIDLARELSPSLSQRIAGREYGQEPQTVAQERRECAMAISLPLTIMGFKDDPARMKEDRFRYKILADLACACLCGPSSPLYHRLFEEGLITRDFACEYELFPGGGCLVLGGESRDPDRTWALVRQEIERIAREGVEESLFRRVKRACYGMGVRVVDEMDELCRQQIEAAFAGHDFLEFPEEFDHVGAGDVTDFLALFAQAQRGAISIVWPSDKGGEAL